jgi:hypothetical protein
VSVLRYLEIAALALLMTISVYVIYSASAWPLQARLFPMVVAIPMLALSAVRLAISARGLATGTVGVAESAAAAEIGMWRPLARQETARLIAWLAAFLILIWLFSFLIGLPLAMLAYLKGESRERWPVAIGLALATFGYLYAVFDQVLHVPWPPGLISSLFLPS